MEQEQLKERTSGGFRYTWWPYLCWISFDGKEFIIKTPFRVFVIPVSQIDKLASVRDMLRFGPKGLRLFHHSLDAPKEIHFISTNWNGWFEAFEKAGIATEDKEMLRTASTIGLGNKIYLFFVILKLLVAIFGLLVAIFGLLLLTK